MPELVYIQVFLADGAVRAWSSSRGKLEAAGPLPEIFRSVRSAESPARALIHLIGDDSFITDEERMNLMDAGRRAGFSHIRFETGEPMTPDDAFGWMTLPFT
jgi:hypothetical protein